MPDGSEFDALLAAIIEPLLAGTLPLLLVDAGAFDQPIVAANDAFTELTGYPASEAIGRNCRFLQGPGTDPLAIGRLRRAIAAGEPAREVLLNHRRDGSPFVNEVLVTPIRDAQGRLRFFSGVLRDLGAVAPRDGVRVRFLCQSDGSLGVPDAGEAGAWLDRVAPGERRRLAHAAARVAGAAGALSLRLPVAGADGATRMHRLEARPVPIAEGWRFEGTLTLMPADEEALGARLRLLEAVSRHAGDTVIITDAEPLDRPGPHIVFVNDAVRRHTGHRPEEVIGRSPRMFQGPATERQEIARIGKALRRWENITSQVLNHRADGSTFWNEMQMTPVADEHGWYTHWISVQRDVSERRRAADRIAFLAQHDALTGIGNRSLAMARLDAALAAAPAAETGVGVVRLDLDRFKLINDTLGHAAGDAALAEAARRLRGAVRAADTVARLGGDEFLAILPGVTDRARLAEVAERIAAAVRGPFDWKQQTIDLAVSVGAALFPDDGGHADELLDAADLVLYRAKRAGRGRVEIASPALRAEAAERRSLAGSLLRALGRGEFVPVFQPQVAIADGTLGGFEALIRWRHPERGLLAPGAFLGVADETGLLAQLGDHMLEAAISRAATWRRAGLDAGRIAVNLAAPQLMRPGFAEEVAGLLARHGLPPQALAIEIVESVFVDDRSGRIEATLAALRAQGIALELDDFGTGFASLTHLRRFRVDRIKIDRSFVEGIGRDADDEAIVAAVVPMAHRLGLGCIAEGVETPAQLAFLHRLGCKEAQGFLIERPMEEEAVPDWIAAHRARAWPPA